MSLKCVRQFILFLLVLFYLVGERCFAEKFPIIDKNTIIEYIKSINQTLQCFECTYVYSLKILPGWYKIINEDSNKPISNKDGYNELRTIIYKRSMDSWYLKNENHFDEEHVSFFEYHCNGSLFWQTSTNDKGVQILKSIPNVPLLYDRLLKSFPNRLDSYYRLDKSEITLVDLLNNKENNIEILSEGNGLINIRIIEHNPRQQFPGMKLLHNIVINVVPDLQLKSYSFGGIYKQGNKEYIFTPVMNVKFSDYQSTSDGAPKIPWNIQITVYGEQSNSIPKSVDDVIYNDRYGGTIPIQISTLSVQSFNCKPIFSNNDISFNYPPGTSVFDQFAHRSYRIGDTLEALRKKIDPTPKP